MAKLRYITPRQVVNSCNLQTDEEFTDEQLSNFFNECIGDMNVRLNINMPLIELEQATETNPFTLDSVYTVLPQQYMTSAAQYYVSYAIKAQDSSTVEAERFWEKYLQIINYMMGKTSDFLFDNTGDGGYDNSEYAGDNNGDGTEYDLTGNNYNFYNYGSNSIDSVNPIFPAFPPATPEAGD